MEFVVVRINWALILAIVPITNDGNIYLSHETYILKPKTTDIFVVLPEMFKIVVFLAKIIKNHAKNGQND